LTIVLFVLLLAIVLFVLRFLTSDYPYGILRAFLKHHDNVIAKKKLVT